MPRSLAERNALIDQYEQGYDVIAALVAPLTDAELDLREAPGEWSPRQVVHHLGDSEMASALRIRRLIALPNPTILGYDQDAYAALLHYDRPIGPSLLAFQGARASTVHILRSMSDSDWEKSGTHSESGFFSAELWLTYYSAHAHDHADQIRRALAANR